MSLPNKIVFITGANRGIGAATVRALLAAGVARIHAGARRIDSLPDFADPRVTPVQIDVTDRASIARAEQTAGDIDILINNAGTIGFGDWITGEDATLETDMRTNFHGTLHVTRAFLPRMQARRSGLIANMVSIVGLAPVPQLAGYSASKAAVHSLTQGLRGSLAGSGIAVVGIYPGPVDTDGATHIPLRKVSPDHVAAKIVEGLGNGDAFIFPDPMAEQIGQLWSTKAREVEKAMLLG